MQLGIDYTLATTHAPGLGRYSRELVRALLAIEGDHQLALWQWGGMQRSIPVEDLGLPNPRPRSVNLRLPGRLQARLARFGMHPGRLLGPLDLFHRILPDKPILRGGLNYSLPLVSIPPQGTGAHGQLRKSLQGATLVFVFCQDYALRAHVEFGIDKQRIIRVRVGSEHWQRDLRGAPSSKLGQVLVLGALGQARRTHELVQAFEHHCEAGGELQLCFAGHFAEPAGPLPEVLARSIYANRMRRVFPREAEMPQLVAQSHGLLHLSLDEGSPVTPLEAIRMGVHPVLERLPAFLEAIGALPCDPIWLDRDPEVEAITEALARLQARPSAEPLEFPEFTWEACARDHMQAWKACV